MKERLNHAISEGRYLAFVERKGEKFCQTTGVKIITCQPQMDGEHTLYILQPVPLFDAQGGETLEEGISHKQIFDDVTDVIRSTDLVPLTSEAAVHQTADLLTRLKGYTTVAQGEEKMPTAIFIRPPYRPMEKPDGVENYQERINIIFTG